MDEIHVRKLKMLKNVQSVFKLRTSLWQQLVTWVTGVDMLGTYITNIEAKNAEITTSEAETSRKHQKIKEMLDSAIVICAAGVDYANAQNDAGLKKTFGISPSKLKKGNEVDVCKRCADIAKIADPIKSKLVEHNMADGEVKVLQDASDAVAEMLAVPRTIIKSNKSLKKEMDKLFYDSEDFLKQGFDKSMRTFLKSQPDFCTEYYTAREIGGWHHKDDNEDEGTGDGASPTK